MVDISGQPELAAVHACGGKNQKTKKIVKVGGGGGGKSGNFQCLIEAEKNWNFFFKKNSELTEFSLLSENTVDFPELLEIIFKKCLECELEFKK